MVQLLELSVQVQSPWRCVAPSIKQSILWFFCASFAVYSIYVWTAGTDMSRARSPDQQVMAGQALFQEMNCVACHQFYGLGGHMGPDLTNVVSAANKGIDYARVIIENGTSKMPDYDLSEVEVDALVQFLIFVDSTGIYPAKQPEISWYGTVAYDASGYAE